MKIAKVIVALDFKGQEELKTFVSKFLYPVWFKVGMELIYDQGFEVISYLKDKGHKVFLDLKLMDIPSTVNQAIASIAQYNVDMTSVHTLGGLKMLQAANGKNSNVKILGVTILTSTNQQVLNKEMKINGSLDQQVVHLAHLAQKAGLYGVVCSGQEAPLIKDLGLNIITPGIRRKQDVSHDQKRIITPQQAKANGATFIVVGRPITQAQDPYKQYQNFVKEFNNG